MPKRKKRKGEDGDGPPPALVVIRPIVPGALVTPSEQRLELLPGNQVLFHVTSLARGRLPRAHLDVFAPNQPVESIPLAMKCKTQRLAFWLLVLAFLIPFCLYKVTPGSWVED